MIAMMVASNACAYKLKRSQHMAFEVPAHYPPLITRALLKNTLNKSLRLFSLYNHTEGFTNNLKRSGGLYRVFL